MNLIPCFAGSVRAAGSTVRSPACCPKLLQRAQFMALVGRSWQQHQQRQQQQPRAGALSMEVSNSICLVDVPTTLGYEALMGVSHIGNGPQAIKKEVKESAGWMAAILPFASAVSQQGAASTTAEIYGAVAKALDVST